MTGSTSLAIEYPPGKDHRHASLHQDIHAALTDALQNADSRGTLADAVDHHLSASGSYLRARLGYQTARALGVAHRDALICACISELLHNASLIHDDVLDHDAVRRGQASVWHAWNEGVAICLGDLFISAAYGVMAELEHHAQRLPALLRLVHHHVHTTIYGQASSFTLAMQSTPDFDQYCQAACGKSGPLFALALEAPLILAGHDQAIETARQSALAFATVYQLVDDIEDHESDMADDQQGVCNILHALNARGDIAPLLSARDYGRHRLAEARHIAMNLPEQSGQALIDEANQLEARLMAVTGDSK